VRRISAAFHVIRPHVPAEDDQVTIADLRPC
jgi:hypothetical protein